jgi:hypothetical protein
VTNQSWKGKLSVKNIFVSLSLAAVFLSATGAYAASDPAKGSWRISTNGQAELDAPTSGTCKVSGAVIAAFYDSLMDLSGGSITIRLLGISIGATNCTSPNFQVTGSYTVTDTGDGNFEINGTFTPQFAGRSAPCSATALNSVSFTMIGKIGGKTATITINGLGSGNYAEGPGAGPLSCQAPILNLNESGTATKF